MRAYVFHFTGQDSTKCSVTIDLIHRPHGYTFEQAQMEAITAVLQVKGTGWVKDWKTQEVQ